MRTRLGETYYRRCYSRRGDQFYHDLEAFQVDAAPDTDQVAVQNGHISVTEIDIRRLGQQLD